MFRFSGGWVTVLNRKLYIYYATLHSTKPGTSFLEIEPDGFHKMTVKKFRYPTTYGQADELGRLSILLDADAERRYPSQPSSPVEVFKEDGEKLNLDCGGLR